MRKAISLFLVFSVLVLSGSLFANEKAYEFSLAIKKAELPKFDLDPVALKRDFLSSLEQTSLTNPPVYSQENFNFYRNSNFWEGAKKGALKGVLIGGIIWLAYISNSESDSGSSFGGISPAFESFLFIAAVGAVMGGLIGGIVEIIS